MILYLEGLDCAHCAEKIRIGAEKMHGVKKAEMNFIAKKLTVYLSDETVDTQVIYSKIKKIVSDLEPDVKVTPMDADTKKAADTEEFSKVEGIIKISRLVITAILFLVGIILHNTTSVQGTMPEIWIYVIAYFIIGYDVLQKAVQNILKGRPFDECFLMTIASLGAFLISSYREAVAVMFLYQLGEMFQDYAVNRSRKSIKALLDIRPDYAMLKHDGTIEKVSPDDVNVGDTIVIKAGEKIALDGIVTLGETLVDTSALTGESIPRKISVGDTVLSGCVNMNGLIEVEVTKEYGESTVSKILELVENSSAKKAKAENFITRFAQVYTPIVVVLALLMVLIPLVIHFVSNTNPKLLLGWLLNKDGWLYRALEFLVVSCPCALVISVPLSYFGGIGGASKKGVLVKGGNSLEALSNCKTIVFDKTGTLTNGSFAVTEIVPTAENVSKLKWLDTIILSEEDVLKYAAYAEHNSNHPVAQSIMKKYNREIPDGILSTEIAGMGVSAKYENHTILVGNSALMEQNKVAHSDTSDKMGTIVHVAVDDVYVGYIQIADDVKFDAKETIAALKSKGIRTVMLTGDRKKSASDTAAYLGIDEFHAELLPDGKVAELENILSQNQNGTTIFVGDGINDAPVLMRADVGIAMGALGSDAAVEAADVVLITDEPSQIVSAINVSRRTCRIVKQNIVFSIGVKIIVLILAMLGITSMWAAVFADVGVCFIAVINAMRARSVK